MMNFASTSCFLRRCWLTILLLAAAPAVHADGVVPGYVLLRLQPGANIAAVARDFGTTLDDQVPDTAIYSLRTPSGQSESSFAARLGRDARITWAETDTEVDAPEHGQTFHFAFDAGGTAGAYINQNAYAQVNLGTAGTRTTGAGVIVAVLDTGATFDHPALLGKYLPGYNALQPGQPPRDIADGASNAAVGHGTMVAGLIARLAPDARILPVRVLDGDGNGTMLDVAKGIYYALAHGARVINMSFGSHDRTSVLNDALDAAEAANVVLVASAGNEAADHVQYPASGKGAIAVAAVEANNTKSPYSSFGSWVRVVAPGTGIRSTYSTGGYANWSGTSFAAPFVAAEAALIAAVQPTLTASGIVETIRGTCRSVDSLNPNYRGKLGKGVIDIDAAVRSVAPPGPSLTGVSLSPADVWGGQSLSASVTLSGPAPIGGLSVSLASNDGAATVPGFVVVPTGQSHVGFTVRTVPVAQFTRVSISAAARGLAKSAALTVQVASVRFLTLSPTTVRGGVQNSVGTITLTSPAPSGGARITLASQSPWRAVVPGFVAVAAGQMTATFLVTSRRVSTPGTLAITATGGVQSRSAGLTVTP